LWAVKSAKSAVCMPPRGAVPLRRCLKAGLGSKGEDRLDALGLTDLLWVSSAGPLETLLALRF